MLCGRPGRTQAGHVAGKLNFFLAMAGSMSILLATQITWVRPPCSNAEP